MGRGDNRLTKKVRQRRSQAKKKAGIAASKAKAKTPVSSSASKDGARK